METGIRSVGCIHCSSRAIYPLLKVDRVPISSQVLYKKRSDAVNCITGSLDIYMCEECGIIFNADYFLTQLSGNQYKDENYYFSVSFSPQSGDYQKRLALEIDSLWNLRDKNVCEIGCGDGFFLNEISKYCNKAVGFEPSFTFQLAKVYQNLLLFNDYFDPHEIKGIKDIKINLFILRHVLEHLSEPFGYLRSLKECYQVREEEQGLFLEVPDAAYLMENNLYFDFYYDHIYYFTPAFLIKFLRELGWEKITQMETGHKEFIKLFCTNADTVEAKAVDDTGTPSYLTQGFRFSQNFDRWKKQIIRELSKIKKGDKKIGAWGAGSRGVTMLISIGSEEGFFSYVIDSDRNKHGRFVPIFGIPIVSEKTLKDEPVDYLLITSYTYFDEIVSGLEGYRKAGLRILRPYPEVDII